MKKIYTILAVMMLGMGSMTAQTMTLKIEGQEVKNGDNVVVYKAAKGTPVGANTMYKLGVKVEFKSLIAQTVETSGIDLDQVTPGLSCCPAGFTCTTANADNGWLSKGTMNNLEADREVNGEWIDYNYKTTKPAEGTVRKSTITFKGASETITFNLTINTDTSAGVETVVVNHNNNGQTYNLAGQKVNANTKGLVIRNGKKIIND